MSAYQTQFSHKYSGRTNSDDYKSQVITKMFPSIRYGRDIDLDRYIMMRENKKPQKEWQLYYHNLVKKYTSDERTQLIRSLRKKKANFKFIFASIIDQLYNRIIKVFKNKITTISNLFSQNGKMLSISEISKMNSSNLLKKLEYIINLFSPDKYEALENINFLVDFAKNNDYKYKDIKQISELISSYIDGSLFAQNLDEREMYSFDMRNEYIDHYGKAPPKQTENNEKEIKRKIQPFKIRVFLTNNDLDDIIIKSNAKSEYDICFTYLQKYMKHINNDDFATKIFVYSRKHRTNHFRIFDAVRKGFRLKHNKERIFDDIFKVICNGRYVYNVSMEKSIDIKLKLLGSALKRKKPIKPALRYLKRKNLNPIQSIQQIKIPIKVKPKKVKASIHRQAVKKKHLKQKHLKYKQTIQIKEKPEAFNDNYKTLSIENMLNDISKEKRLKRKFKDEFNKRLTASITNTFYLNEATSVNSNRENMIDKLKDLIHYILRNYDNILTQHEKTEIYKNKIEEFGFSIHTVYSIIIQCFTELKTDYLTGNFKIKKGLFSRYK